MFSLIAFWATNGSIVVVSGGNTVKSWVLALASGPLVLLIIAIALFAFSALLAKLPQRLERRLLGPHWITPRPVGWLSANALERRDHQNLMQRLEMLQPPREPVQYLYQKTFKDKYTDQRWIGQLEDTAKSNTYLLTPELDQATDHSSMSTLQRARRWYVFRYLM